MKCHEARSLLTPYLNKEITRSERELLQAHLAECEQCWHEFNALSATQQQLRVGIAEYAALAQPSTAAWPKLQRALHTKHVAPRPAPRGIAPGLSTLIAAAGAALFVFGGLMTPAALNRPIATLSPTALTQPGNSLDSLAPTVILSEQSHEQSSTSTQTAPVPGQITAAPNTSNTAPDDTDMSGISKDTLNKFSANPITASRRNTNPFSTAIEDEGIERFRDVPLQRSGVRKTKPQPSVVLCSWCAHME